MGIMRVVAPRVFPRGGNLGAGGWIPAYAGPTRGQRKVIATPSNFVGPPLTFCCGAGIFAVFGGNRPKKFRGLSNTRVPGVLYTCVPRSAALAALIVRTAEQYVASASNRHNR